jgi:hypothetical protein
LEEEIEELQKTLDSKTEEMGYHESPGIEQVYGSNIYGNRLTIFPKLHTNGRLEAEKEERSAEAKLALVEKRLSLAQSPPLGDTVEKEVWTTLAVEEVQLASQRMI